MWSSFTKDALPIGTEIDVDGYLATTAGRATGREVTFPDGRKLCLASSGPDALDQEK